MSPLRSAGFSAVVPPPPALGPTRVEALTFLVLAVFTLLNAYFTAAIPLNAADLKSATVLFPWDPSTFFMLDIWREGFSWQLATLLIPFAAGLASVRSANVPRTLLLTATICMLVHIGLSKEHHLRMAVLDDIAYIGCVEHSAPDTKSCQTVLKRISEGNTWHSPAWTERHAHDEARASADPGTRKAYAFPFYAQVRSLFALGQIDALNAKLERQRAAFRETSTMK